MVFKWDPVIVLLRVVTQIWNHSKELLGVVLCLKFLHSSKKGREINEMEIKCLWISKWGKEIREEWSCRWQVKFVLRTYIAVVLKSVRFKNILLSPGDQLSACQEEYQKNLRRQSASRYVPRCAADGSYGEVQCTGGLCYCVTPRGEQIHGTKTFNSARKPNCSHPGILKP